MNPFFSTYLIKRLSKPEDVRSSPPAPESRRVARFSPWMMYAIGLILLSIITLAVVWYEFVAVRA